MGEAIRRQEPCPCRRILCKEKSYIRLDRLSRLPFCLSLNFLATQDSAKICKALKTISQLFTYVPPKHYSLVGSFALNPIEYFCWILQIVSVVQMAGIWYIATFQFLMLMVSRLKFLSSCYCPSRHNSKPAVAYDFGCLHMQFYWLFWNDAKLTDGKKSFLKWVICRKVNGHEIFQTFVAAVNL